LPTANGGLFSGEQKGNGTSHVPREKEGGKKEGFWNLPLGVRYQLRGSKGKRVILRGEREGDQ